MEERETDEIDIDIASDGNGEYLADPAQLAQPVSTIEADNSLRTHSSKIANEFANNTPIIESSTHTYNTDPATTSCIPPSLLSSSQHVASQSSADDSISDSQINATQITLDPTTPHPIEIKACPEFFIRKNHQQPQDPSFASSSSKKKHKLPTNNVTASPGSKNADRYLLIRNTILVEWERIKPKYLIKSATRPLLKGHGDVHAISRVHKFLEEAGFINFGLDEEGLKVRKRKREAFLADLGDGVGVGGSDESRLEYDPSSTATVLLAELLKAPKRQLKRVRNAKGEWVDKSELYDGRTIVHDKDGKPLSDEEPMTFEEIAEEKRMFSKNAKYFADEELMKYNPALLKKKRRQLQKQYYYYGNDFEDEQNEFRLIPLEKGGQDFVNGETESSLRFKVIVESNIQLVIDFHSHLAETEIIGLLGGIYDSDEKILYCEMDPESEVKAHIYFATKDKSVVGWYHSHPTFDPNPSIRDIETQTDHQHLFARESDGIEPFVGAIYSPYDPRSEGVIKIPYSCDCTIIPSSGLSDALLQQLYNLIDEFKSYEFRVDLSHSYKKTMTRLEKLVGALQIHVFTCINLSTADITEGMAAAEEFIAKHMVSSLTTTPRLSATSSPETHNRLPIPQSLGLDKKCESKRTMNNSAASFLDDDSLSDSSEQSDFGYKKRPVFSTDSSHSALRRHGVNLNARDRERGRAESSERLNVLASLQTQTQTQIPPRAHSAARSKFLSSFSVFRRRKSLDNLKAGKLNASKSPSKNGFRTSAFFSLLRYPILIGIGVIICLDLTALILIRLFVLVYEKLILSGGRQQFLRQLMEQADSYERWKTAASYLDSYMNHDDWKQQESDNDIYNSKLIRKTTNKLLTARMKNDPREAMRHLTHACKKNHGGCMNEGLYCNSFDGTKVDVETFFDEVEDSILFVADSETLSIDEKRAFFKNISRTYGKTALSLSGGASLTFYHMGVLKALFQEELLPDVITGTSGGAFLAALICTRTNEELIADQVFNPKIIAASLNMMSDSWTTRINRYLTYGYMFDPSEGFQKLESLTKGHLTFLEAYKKTGRILCISVTPDEPNSITPAKVLNFLTAPDVVISSAVCASSAVPGVLPPIKLICKTDSGELVPYKGSGKLWRDGSIRTDIPDLTMLNVNFQIVSQDICFEKVEFSQFFYESQGSAGCPTPHRNGRGWRGGFIASSLCHMIDLDLKKWLRLCKDLKLLPPVGSTDVSDLFLQQFDGTVTILPANSNVISDMVYALEDPTPETLAKYMARGEVKTFPKLGMIGHRMRIERIVKEVRQELSMAKSEENDTGTRLAATETEDGDHDEV
ncbi:hypothetical protein HK100_008914 [Physocladia obscura]|uniref:PNPLA domain-containing protein n=1 Tax=Physocladia obscura TaxID=109957 RepID=A0AAD5T5G7_9FUNG|nr:hypothetical protein HK100_008914 [Physocladia obscura]